MAKQFTFHPNLYLGNGIEKKNLDKIKKRLLKKPIFAGVYLIVPASGPSAFLDIFDARQLALPHYQKKSFYVIGIAADYTDALKLIEKVTQECVSARGDCNLREYLSC